MSEHGGSGSNQPGGSNETEPQKFERPDLYVNMAFDGSEVELEPTVCRRADGQAIFYPNAVNTVFGLSGEGKTWLTLVAVAETLNAGSRVLFIDIDDNGPGAIKHRLTSLGVTPELVANKGRFLYTVPGSIEDFDSIVRDMKDWKPTLAVIDSIGTVITMSGGSANDADDFNRVNIRVMVPLSQTGAAVVYIDHLSKNPDSAKHGAQGSSAKLQRISGASIRVVAKDAFTPGKGGQSVLTSNKDRHGGLWKACEQLGEGHPDKVMVGTFTLSDDEGILSWEISPDGESATPKQGRAPRDRIAELEAMDPRPSSASEAAKRLGGNKQAALKAWAEFTGSGSIHTPRFAGTGTTEQVAA